MVHLGGERIPGFIPLDASTSIYRPPSYKDSQHGSEDGDAVAKYSLQNKQTEPDLIVFCSWMSAQPKHMAKYVDGYRERFPHTSILLVEARCVYLLLRHTPALPPEAK